MNANNTVIGSGGGGGGGGCFVGSTLVSVPNGQTRIDEIREGTEVLSFDDKGKIAACKVLKVHKHEQEEVASNRQQKTAREKHCLQLNG